MKSKYQVDPMKSFSQIHEEGADRLRDRRMEYGGVDGNTRYDRPARSGGTQPNTFGKKKPKYDGMSALEKVKADIRAKHGKGAIKEDAKMGKQSDEKLAALHKQVSGSDQSLPSNQFMLKRVTKEMNRRKKATKTEGYAPGDVDQKVGAVTPIPKKDQDDARARILAKAKAKRKEKLAERADMWHPDPEKDRKLGGPGANQRAREDRADAAKPKADPKKLKDGESYMDYSKRQKASKQKYSPELQKRMDAAKAKKKEGIVGKIARKIGLKKEGMTFNQFCIEAHIDD